MNEHRRLGTPTLTGIVVANMIGAGVFTTSGFALADLGTSSRVMTAWVAGGVVALLGALSYGALAVRLRESGGEYLFLSRTIHPFAGFLAGWVSLWAGFTGAIAFAAEAAQGYLAPWIPEGVPLDLVGSGAIVFAGMLHAAGVGPGSVVQNTAVVVKIVLIVALVTIGFTRLPEATVASEAAPMKLDAFVITLMWVSLSYSGWNAAVYVAGEAKDLERTLPRSLLVGASLVTVLYLALNWVFLHAAPFDVLAGKPDVAAVAAAALGGERLESLVRVLLVLALFTSISSMVMIGPRVYAQMARDGVFPRLFAFEGRVPAAAIWLQVALAIAILWASRLRQQLTNLGWILGLATAIAVLGLVILRRREGPERVPIPGYPVVPVSFVVLVLALTGTTIVVRGSELGPALAVLGSGAVVYALMRRG